MLSFPDRVLLCVFGYRTNLTFEQLAALFDISDTTAHRVVADLTPHLAALLGPPPTDRRELWIVDGTLIPVRDRSRTGKSKNYRRSVNVQVVSRYRDRRICAVGNAWPGNRNDSVVYRDTVMDVCVGHGRVIGDGGYRSCPGVTSPARGPDQRIIRDGTHRRFVKKRARAEHSIELLKQFRVLRDCRRRGDAIDQITRATAALVNLRLGCL